MIQDAIEATDFIQKNPSPLIIFLFITILIAFKGKDILYFFYEIRDLSKTRLINKLKTEIEISEIHENQEIKTLLIPYYNELQLQAIIGDPKCSSHIAKYILTRDEIHLAISRYKSSKNLIIFNSTHIHPILDGKFPAWRIHLNWIVGLIVYLFFSFFAAAPYFLYSFLNKESQIKILQQLSFTYALLFILL